MLRVRKESQRPSAMSQRGLILNFLQVPHGIAHSPVSVLQAKHAQMDARTTEAAQKGPR